MIELLWRDAINRNADRADAERARRAAMIQAEKQQLAFEIECIKERRKTILFAAVASLFLIALASLFIVAISQTAAPMHKQAIDTARGLGYLYGI